MEGPVIDFRKSLRSFQYAFAGLLRFFQEENNARVHLLMAVVACTIAFWVRCSIIEWCLLIFSITLVLVAEIINTSLERLSDKVATSFHPLIKAAKDLAAAAVLVASIGAGVIGTLILVPKVLTIL